ncbi:MAG: hypothetical protein ACLFPX_00055 [Candidatus Omnitrophota bacterium]
MSTIHDALKKVQQKMSPGKENVRENPVTSGLSPQEKQDAEQPGTPSPSPKINPKRPTLFRIFLAAFFCLILAGTITYLIYIRGVSHQSPSASTIITSAQDQAEPIRLKLNGISRIEGRKVALINNEIYEQGQTVSGLTVESIAMGQVVLTDPSGARQILKVMP